MKCPICQREYKRLLALSRYDTKTMICDSCGQNQALDDFFYHKNKMLSPYDRTRNAVYASGNKWAIENFEATHN